VLAAIALVACRPESRPAQPGHVAAIDTPAIAGPAATMTGAVTAVCDTVAARWRATGQAEVRLADTTSLAYHETTPDHGCMVLVTAPQDVDSTRWRSLYWAADTVSSWTEIVEYFAEGPDGNTRTFDRAGVRCQVDFTQDGGDDSDSTYVPSPAIGETTFCWARSAVTR
jgi:hypothetical protein